eukprot:4290650-Amphidinium_carterae.3
MKWLILLSCVVYRRLSCRPAGCGCPLDVTVFAWKWSADLRRGCCVAVFGLIRRAWSRWGVGIV